LPVDQKTLLGIVNDRMQDSDAIIVVAAGLDPEQETYALQVYPFVHDVELSTESASAFAIEVLEEAIGLLREEGFRQVHDQEDIMKPPK